MKLVYSFGISVAKVRTLHKKKGGFGGKACPPK